MTKNKYKPVDTDIHFKYLCGECGDLHWLSFKEASTPKFKVVCECGNIFTVKRVIGYKIKYKKKQTEVEPKIENKEISVDLLNCSVRVLTSYGFAQKEASNLITTSYKNNPLEDCASLVKQTLEDYNKSCQ